MPSDNYHESQTRSRHGLFRKRYDVLRTLPSHGWWTVKTVESEDVTEMGSLIEKAINAGLLDQGPQIDVQDTESGHRKTVYVYSATQPYRDMLGDYDGPDRTVQLPCGHHGFENRRGTDFIHCPVCEGRWLKEEVDR